MKRIIILFLAIVICFSLVGCEGNYFEVDIQEPEELSESNMIHSAQLEKLCADNAISVFEGSSGGLKYSWLIFGSQITEAKDSNLSVQLQKQDNGILVTFAGERSFPATLSIALDEKWQALTASAYSDGKKVADVALVNTPTTENAATILNFPVEAFYESCIILPNTFNGGNTEISNRPNSDGTSTEQDSYLTDPVPEGKPLPVEPGKEADKTQVYSCSFSIECSAILNNLTQLEEDKREILPWDGVILPPTKVEFYAGESVFDVLQRVCKEFNIHLESSWTPVYNSAYVEGIENLYEFDCGSLSGWMYRVDGWYPNYGCSRYQLADGETVEWRFTCDLGNDVGCDWMVGTYE
jgi:hypothetical protein